METTNMFFDMVKYWTISDYWTPKIKSEIIIDMLISEFIEEIVSYGLGEDNLRNIKLIAKEFPIPRVGQIAFKKKGDKPTKEDTRQYASVDFLMADSKDKPSNLYFVELKTTDDSFDGKQMLNMLWTCNQGTKSLYYRFCELIEYHLKEKMENCPIDGNINLCWSKYIILGNGNSIRRLVHHSWMRYALN